MAATHPDIRSMIAIADASDAIDRTAVIGREIENSPPAAQPISPRPVAQYANPSSKAWDTTAKLVRIHVIHTRPVCERVTESL